MGGLEGLQPQPEHATPCPKFLNSFRSANHILAPPMENIRFLNEKVV